MAAKTWQAQVMNFAGIALFEGSAVQWVPSGDYKVQIIDLDPHSKGTSVFVRTKIIDGPQAGKFLTRNNGLTVNEGNSRAWKSTYLSAGWTEESMETSFAPTPEATAPLLGRTAYVHVESPPNVEGGSALKMEDIDVQFIRPQTFLKRQTEQKQAAPAAPGTQFAAGSPPPALPNAPTAAPAPGGATGTLFGAPPNGAPTGAPPPAPAAGGAPPPPPQ